MGDGEDKRGDAIVVLDMDLDVNGGLLTILFAIIKSFIADNFVADDVGVTVNGDGVTLTVDAVVVVFSSSS